MNCGIGRRARTSDREFGLTAELGLRGSPGDLGQAGRELSIVMKHFVLADQHRDLTSRRVLNPGHERACVGRSGSYGLRLGTARGQARHDRSGAHRCSSQRGTLDKDATRMLSHSWKPLRRQHGDYARRHSRDRDVGSGPRTERVVPAPRTLCGIRPIAKRARPRIMRQQLLRSTWNRNSDRDECDSTPWLLHHNGEASDFRRLAHRLGRAHLVCSITAISSVFV